MKDRVAGAPGQYKASVSAEDLLKMQAGEEFTIQMQRDDQPIEEGTPYNKAAVLPDELAQQLCPGIEDPTPADALAALNNRIKPVLLWESAEASEQPEQVIPLGDVSAYSEYILQFYNHGQLRSRINRHIHVHYTNVYDTGVMLHKRTFYLSTTGDLSVSKCLAWNKNQDAQYQDDNFLLLEKVYGIKGVDE